MNLAVRRPGGFTEDKAVKWLKGQNKQLTKVLTVC